MLLRYPRDADAARRHEGEGAGSGCRGAGRAPTCSDGASAQDEGGLDVYHYPNGLTGRAVATKELLESPNGGSSNAVYRGYEIVMFTRQPLDLDAAEDESTPFGQMHKTINAILDR